MLKLFLFGTPRCQQDGHPLSLPRRKCLALLAYLALNPQPHSRETLASLLYPSSANALSYLRRTLSEIRHNLAGELLIAGAEVKLAADKLWVDVLEYEHIIEREEHILKAGGMPISSLESAVSLYTADFMAGFTLPDAPAFDEWQFFQAEALNQSLAAVLQRLLRWHTFHHEFEMAIVYGRRWLALDPLHEPAHRELMRLYAAAGQQVAALRQYDECKRLLQDELGISPDEETRSLYELIRSRQWAAQTKFIPEPLHNFPPQSTPFIGRQKEIAHINRSLIENPACRLFTIVGQGGIGKTRLAMEVGQQLVPAFTAGACFVPLAPVSQIEDLVPAIGMALNLQFSGRQSLRDQLLANLQGQHLLLILDNFEHLLDDVDLLTEILSVAPKVKILVTSRERLNVQREWTYNVVGLTYPQHAAAPASLGILLEIYSAPALFVQRAQQARAAFKPSAQNWPAILDICHLVEGMPLGLELAASWIPTMSCQEIAAGIARTLDFLTTTLRDVPQRHNSLRAVFQHSWSLLPTGEQAVLRQLSVFRGGFTREAAEQVTGIALLPLAALVRKSLVIRENSGRYKIHELLRQFAAEKLAEPPDAVLFTRQAHATYFATFLQERQGDLWASRQLQALHEIAADLENVRQGWRWAVEKQEVALLNQSAIALFFFYDMRGHIQEGERAFRLALQKLQENASPAERRLCLGRLLMGQGWFTIWAVSFMVGEELLKQAAVHLRSIQPLPLEDLSLTLNYLGLILCFRGKIVWGTELLQEGLTLAQEAGSQALIGRSLFNLGQTATIRGEYRQAEPFLIEALHILVAINEQQRRSMVLARLGETMQGMGDYSRAESYFQEALIIRRELDDRIRLPSTVKSLGLLAYQRGDYDRAEILVQESLAINRQTGNLYQIGEDHEALGLIALARAQLARAAEYLNRSLDIFREMGIHNRQPEVLNSLAELAMVHGVHTQAKAFLTEALALTQDNGNLAQQARTLHLSGDLLLHEKLYPQAAQRLAEALDIASRIGAAPLALAICLSTVPLFVLPTQNEHARAATLLQLALLHPASEKQTRERAEALQETLPTKPIYPWGSDDRDLWATVAELKMILKQI